MKNLVLWIMVFSFSLLVAEDSIDNYLNKVEREMNKALPQMIDKEIRWDSVKVKGLTVQHNFTILKFSVGDVNMTKEMIFYNIQNNLCYDATIVHLLHSHVRYDYNYVNEKREKLFNLALSDCLPFLISSCEQKEDKSCLILAQEYMRQENNEESANAYAKACDNNVLKGCSVLAEMYADGIGVKKSDATALKLYTKACDGNYSIACTQLGLIYSMGQGVDINNIKAFTLHEKACEISNGKMGCTNLATHYESGKGVNQDYKKALKLYTKDCELSKRGIGCSNAGSIYMNGQGIQKDFSKAEELFVKSCNRDEPQGCYNLGFLYSERKAYKKSAFFYDKACESNFALGCNNLGALYFNGQGIITDKYKAKKLFKKSCSLLNVLGCKNYTDIKDNVYQPISIKKKRGKIIDKKGNILAQGSGKDRVYPEKGMIVHTVGFTSFSKKTDFIIGKIGLEKQYEDDLKNNQDIVVNMDLALQKKITEFFGDKSGVAIVMNTDGGILSAVSLPSYDPSLFVKGISKKEWKTIITDLDHPFSNKISSTVYSPASTVKMGVALAMGNNENVDKNITCNGFMELGEEKHKFKCWKNSGHGEVSLRKAIQENCDVYFYNKALKLDIDTIAKGLNQMGLGVKTGIDLPRERKAIVPTKAWKLKRFNTPWHKEETVMASIGQGYTTVTPIQLARYTAFLASGKLPTPHVAYKIGKKEIIPKYKEVEDINQSILKEVRQGMYDVCNRKNGTANGLFSKLSTKIAGKTGTIPILYLPQSEEKRMTKEEQIYYKLSHKIMVSYAPYDKPKYVVVVLVEHDEANENSAMVISSKIHEWMEGNYDVNEKEKNNMDFLIKKMLNTSIVELDKNNYPKWVINLFIKRLESENNVHGHTLESMHYYSKLALLYFKLINKGDSSEKLLQKSLKNSKEVEKRLDTLVTIEEKLLMYNHLIWLSNYQKEYKKSFKYGEKKLKIIELEFGKYNKNTSLAMNYLAGEADALGKRKRAIELYELSKDIDVKLYGKNHNYCIPAYKNLAYIYEEYEEYDKALKFHNKIIKTYEKVDSSRLDIAFAYNSLGYFYMKFKKYEDALKVFKKSLNIYLKLSGENHHNTAVSYLNIAESYYELENYSEAQTYAQKAYDIRVKVLDDEHEQLLTVKELLSEILKKLSTVK